MTLRIITVPWEDVPVTPHISFSYKFWAVYKYFGINGYVAGVAGLVVGVVLQFMGDV